MLLECDVCAATVDAELQGSYETNPAGKVDTEEITLLRCPRCHRPFVVSKVAVNYATRNGLIFEDVGKVLFPRQRVVDPSLPASIRSVYAEALDCFRGRTFRACVMLCRTTIEAMCREHGATGHLTAALRKLNDDDVIDKRLFEWANQLRLAGNVAVHDASSSVSREEASDVMDFTHALLEYVFTFRAKFDAFKRRHEERTKRRVEDAEHDGD